VRGRRRYRPGVHPTLVPLSLAMVLLAGCDASVTEDAAPALDGSETSSDEVGDRGPVVPALHPEVDDWDAATVTLVTPDGAKADLAVRVARTPAQRQRGLMHVPEVPEGAGMLFVFEQEGEGGFWMKDTLVPLDIAFAGRDGTVRATLTMEPCAEEPCPTHDPGVAYDRALEVPAGWFRSEGIGVGARLEVAD
jgi:uncharacterized protein